MKAQPLRKKLLATAEHNRVNMQAIFVNQIVLGQGMNQYAAAIDDDVFAGLALSSPPKSPEGKSCHFRSAVIYCLHEQSTYSF